MMASKTLTMMLEAYKKSGQNVDTTQPWDETCLAGAASKGMQECFDWSLLALKYQILQNLIEAFLDKISK